MKLKRDICTINKLMMFIEVAKNGQIKNTAFANGYKQSNLSKAIKELETEMETTLFNRQQNGVSLTKDGQEVFELACEITNALHKVTTYKTAIHDTKGDIRLWAGDGIASGYISEILPEFYEKYPNIRIDFKCSMDNPMQIHETDIAVVYEKPSQTNATIISEHKLQFNLFASKEYISKYGIPKNIDDLLQNHKICNRESFSNAWKKWNDTIKKANFLCVNTNSSNLLLELIKKNVGIGLLPVNLGYENQNLVKLDKLDISFTHPFWIITHKSNHSCKKIQALINSIRNI